MGDTVPDKNVELNGKIIGANSTLKLSVKTALWIAGVVVGIMMTILTYSYFDLKSDVNAAQQEFIEKVDGEVEKMGTDIQTIRIDQATIKGDIKLILDRQTRDNPVNPTNVEAQPVTPPSR